MISYATRPVKNLERMRAVPRIVKCKMLHTVLDDPLAYTNDGDVLCTKCNCYRDDMKEAYAAWCETYAATRAHTKDKLGQWLADRIDQLAYETLSGGTHAR